jgi:hypothetical protein
MSQKDALIVEKLGLFAPVPRCRALKELERSEKAAEASLRMLLGSKREMNAPACHTSNETNKAVATGPSRRKRKVFRQIPNSLTCLGFQLLPHASIPVCVTMWSPIEFGLAGVYLVVK